MKKLAQQRLQQQVPVVGAVLQAGVPHHHEITGGSREAASQRRTLPHVVGLQDNAHPRIIDGCQYVAAAVGGAVVGAGHVGLAAAACLARLGRRVTCTDVDAARIAGLKRAEIPICEPGLVELVREGLDSGGLSFHCGSDDVAPMADNAVSVPDGVGGDG